MSEIESFPGLENGVTNSPITGIVSAARAVVITGTGPPFKLISLS